MKASIWATSSLTEPKLLRRMACRVRIPNHVSTWSVQDAEVGVKWNVIQGRSSSQARTAGVDGPAMGPASAKTARHSAYEAGSQS